MDIKISKSSRYGEEINMSLTQVLKKDNIKELIEQYKIAVDMLGLAEIISIKEHEERAQWIKEWEKKLYE